jgi:hypothetical protein
MFTGSKYREYISNITIMHNNNINQTKSIMNELLANAQIRYNIWYNRYNVHTYTRLNHLSGNSFKERVAGNNWDPTMHSRDILLKPRRSS